MRASLVGLALSPGSGRGLLHPRRPRGRLAPASRRRSPERPRPLPRRLTEGEARPRPQDGAHRPCRVRHSSRGTRVRHDGRLVPPQPGETRLRSGRYGLRPPRPPDPRGEGGRRERRKGRPVCRHFRGKSGRLRLPARRRCARPCGGALGQDRRRRTWKNSSPRWRCPW